MSASIIPCAPKQLFQLSFVSCILKGCETRCFPTTTPVVALRAWLAATTMSERFASHEAFRKKGSSSRLSCVSTPVLSGGLNLIN